MTPKKALELVTRYAVLTKKIKALKETIGTSLDGCTGFSGKRGVLDENFCCVQPRDEDHKGREKDVHLWAWYTPEVKEETQYTEGGLVYRAITAATHGAECPHCYAAHLAIQERKAARKSLAAIKSAMTRSAA